MQRSLAVAVAAAVAAAAEKKFDLLKDGMSHYIFIVCRLAKS